MSASEADSSTNIPMIPAGLSPEPPAAPQESEPPKNPLKPSDWPNYKVLGETILNHQSKRKPYFGYRITHVDMIGIVSLYACNDVLGGETPLPRIEAYLAGTSFVEIADMLKEQKSEHDRTVYNEKSVRKFFEKTMPRQVFRALGSLEHYKHIRIAGGSVSELTREERIAAIRQATTGRNRGGAFSAGDFAAIHDTDEKTVWRVIIEEINSGRLQGTEAPLMRLDGEALTGHYRGRAADVILTALSLRITTDEESTPNTGQEKNS